MNEPIVDSYDSWGVELPGGTECECRDEADADAIIEAAKMVSPRARYKKIVRSVFVGEWQYSS